MYLENTVREIFRLVLSIDHGVLCAPSSTLFMREITCTMTSASRRNSEHCPRQPPECAKIVK